MTNLRSAREKSLRIIMLKLQEYTLLPTSVQPVETSLAHWLSFTTRLILTRNSLKSSLRLQIKEMISVKHIQRCLGWPLNRLIQESRLSKQNTRSKACLILLLLTLTQAKQSLQEVAKMCKILRHGTFGGLNENINSLHLIMKYLSVLQQQKKLSRHNKSLTSISLKDKQNLKN